MRTITKVLAILGVLLIGFSLIGVSYAYTSSTENTDNTTVSEYVVLSQPGGYSFGTTDATIKTKVTRDVNGNPLVTYTITGASSTSLTFNDNTYIGIRVGNASSLQGTYNGAGEIESLSGITVETVSGTFLDLSSAGWYYVIKVTYNEQSQYVYWDGHAESWQGTITLLMDELSENQTYVYAAELFLAIPDPSAGNATRFSVAGSQIISDGTIRYVYTSEPEQ